MTMVRELFEEGASSPRWAAYLALLIGLWALYSLLQRGKSTTVYKFPSPVPGIPFFGNTFQMPKTGHGPFFAELAKKHGEMFTLTVGGTKWLVLNSRRVVDELLTKRAAIYSSRQRLPMANELASGNKRILLMPYGNLWRAERKVMHQILNQTKRDMFTKYQDIESRTLLFDFLKQPDLWYKANGRFSNSVIMSVIFGRRTSLLDPDLKELYATSDEFVKYLMPGMTLVDAFPFLLSLPIPKVFQPWRWAGDALYRRTRNVYQKQIDLLQERQRQGTANPCFMTEFLDLEESQNFKKDEIAFIAGALLEAGSDTTRITLNQVIAAAAQFPDWVGRVQEQLEEVCGYAQRLPTLEDAPKLPLVKAVIKESLRWRPIIGETGIPHAVIQDDSFEGYTIPAGTIVTWNHWGISNDPNEYKDPDRFWPERFLDDELDAPLKGHLGFGAGRRICVGWSVAYENLLIAISRLLYCFEFVQDPSGPIYTKGPLPMSAGSAPFKVQIKIRSTEHETLILKECTESSEINL